VQDLAILVQILSPKRRYCQVSIASIVSFEEVKSIAASNNANALIVEERGWVSFEERDVVRVR
jgi:hypothetical protein